MIFYLGSSTSPLGSGAFSRYLETNTETAGKISISISKSTTVKGYAYTRNLNIADWQTGSISVKVYVITPKSNIYLSVQAHRVNSSGTILESSSVTSEKSLSSITSYTFTIPSKDWTQGNLTDNLRIDYIFRNSATSGSSSLVEIETGTVNDNVDTPFSYSTNASVSANSMTSRVSGIPRISVTDEYIFEELPFLLDAAMLDSTHAIMCFSSVGAINSLIATVNNDTITYGSSYSYSCASIKNISIAVLDSTHVLIGYLYEVLVMEQKITYDCLLLATISGNTITYSGEYHQGSSNDISLVTLDSTHALFYSNGGAFVVTISGDTISVGTGYTIGSINSTASKMILLGANKVLFTYSSYSGTGVGKIVTINGDTITCGSDYQFNDTALSYISSAMIDSNHVAVAYKDSSGYGTMIMATINGDVITYSSEYVFNIGTTNYISLILNNDYLIVFYENNTGTNYGAAIIATINNGNISFGGKYIFNPENSDFISAVKLSADNILLVYKQFELSSLLLKFIPSDLTITAVSQVDSNTNVNAPCINLSSGFNLPDVSIIVPISIGISAPITNSSTSFNVPGVLAVKRSYINVGVLSCNTSLKTPSLLSSRNVSISAVKSTVSQNLIAPKIVISKVTAAVTANINVNFLTPSIFTKCNIYINSIKAGSNTGIRSPGITVKRNVLITETPGKSQTSSINPVISIGKNVYINAGKSNADSSFKNPSVIPSRSINTQDLKATVQCSLLSTAVSAAKNVSISVIKSTSQFSSKNPVLSLSKNISSVCIKNNVNSLNPHIDIGKNALITGIMFNSQCSSINPSILTSRNLDIKLTAINVNTAFINPNINNTKNADIQISAVNINTAENSPLITVNSNENISVSSLKTNTIFADPIISTTRNTDIYISTIASTSSLLAPSLAIVSRSFNFISIDFANFTFRCFGYVYADAVNANAVLNNTSPTIYTSRNTNIEGKTALSNSSPINPNIVIENNIQPTKAEINTNSISPSIKTTLEGYLTVPFGNSSTNAENPLICTSCTITTSAASQNIQGINPNIYPVFLFSIEVSYIENNFNTNIYESGFNANILEMANNVNIFENNIGVVIMPFIGDTIKLSAEFRDYDGNLVNPTSITMKIYEGYNLLVETREIPLSSKVSEGKYEFEYTIPSGSGPLIYEICGIVHSTPSLLRGKISREWVR